MTRILRLRSSGDDVRFLQERLNTQPTARPLLTLDDMFGANLRNLMQEFKLRSSMQI